MILADKITELRKKAGWSQEELGIQMGGCAVGSRHGENPAVEQSFRREHGLLIKR